MEALHVVVLPASEATAASGGTPRTWYRGAPIGGRLLAGVREALAEATQVLPVTILTIGEVRLGCWGFAHVWGSLRRRWWEGQRGSPWGGRWRRDPWRGKLIRGWGRRTVAKTCRDRRAGYEELVPVAEPTEYRGQCPPSTSYQTLRRLGLRPGPLSRGDSSDKLLRTEADQSTKQ